MHLIRFSPHICPRLFLFSFFIAISKLYISSITECIKNKQPKQINRTFRKAKCLTSFGHHIPCRSPLLRIHKAPWATMNDDDQIGKPHIIKFNELYARRRLPLFFDTNTKRMTVGCDVMSFWLLDSRIFNF